MKSNNFIRIFHSANKSFFTLAFFAINVAKIWRWVSFSRSLSKKNSCFTAAHKYLILFHYSIYTTLSSGKSTKITKYKQHFCINIYIYICYKIIKIAVIKNYKRFVSTKSFNRMCLKKFHWKSLILKMCYV